MYFVYLNLIHVNIIRGSVEVALEPTVRLRVKGESSNPKVSEPVFSGHWLASGKIVMKADFMKIY